MNAKLVLLGIVASLASACAETPTWDNSVFLPPQVVYGKTPVNEAAVAPAAVPAK